MTIVQPSGRGPRTRCKNRTILRGLIIFFEFLLAATVLKKFEFYHSRFILMSTFRLSRSGDRCCFKLL